MLWALGGSSLAAAAPADRSTDETDESESEGEAGGPELVVAGDRPTRAPAHADCNFRMPLHEHVVEPGEHLGIIAGHYGVRSAELVALNPQLPNPDLIHPGDKIRVCPEIFPRLTQRVEHVVAPGETLGAIAAQHGISLEALLEQQKGAITNPNHVRVGQTLVLHLDGGLVPDFLPPEPKKARAKRAGGHARVATQLRSSPHLHVKHPQAAFGTAKTIRLLERAVGQYSNHHGGGPKVLVGDISLPGGGSFSPHVSHRTGRDVDLGYVLKGDHGTRTRFGGVNQDTLDVRRTWALIKAFIDTREVVYVFVDYRIQGQLYEHAKSTGIPQKELDELFQYPHGRGKAHGIIRHWPSHRHHFHVRFRS